MAEWMAEELADEMENVPEGGLSVPVTKRAPKFCIFPNPREYTSNPNMFQTYIKFFTYTNTDWTISSRMFDITNWAYYLGDDENTVTLIRNLVSEARRLKVKTLLSTECGHGFKILRKDAERLLGEPLGFEVLSVVELAGNYLKEGRLKLASDSHRGESNLPRSMQRRPKVGRIRAPTGADQGRSLRVRRTLAQQKAQHLLRRGGKRRTEHRHGEKTSGNTHT